MISEYFFNFLHIVHFCQRQQNMKKYTLSGMPRLFDTYW